MIPADTQRHNKMILYFKATKYRVTSYLHNSQNFTPKLLSTAMTQRQQFQLEQHYSATFKQQSFSFKDLQCSTRS